MVGAISWKFPSPSECSVAATAPVPSTKSTSALGTIAPLGSATTPRTTLPALLSEPLPNPAVKIAEELVPAGLAAGRPKAVTGGAIAKIKAERTKGNRAKRIKECKGRLLSQIIYG